jgi:RNA polymerase sigma-70 factor (ECF subfamily)
MRSADATLIDGFLDGDGAAVATVDGWIDRAASSYRRRLGHRWDDVLQDLRLEITRLLREERFAGRSSLKTYLYRVVSNRCLNLIRSQRQWRWTEIDELDRGAEPAPGPAAPSGRSASGSRRHETRDLLLRVLEKTSPECRRLWRMIVEGLSYREMKERTGVSEGALRVRVLRCRKTAAEIRDRLLGGTVAEGV